MRHSHPKIKFGIDKTWEKNFFRQFSDNPYAMVPELRFLFQKNFKEDREKIISAYVDNFYKINRRKILSAINKTKTEWTQEEKYFFHEVDRVFNGYPWPRGSYRGFISIWRFFPRNIEKKCFTFPFNPEVIWHKKFALAVIAHEMMHFITYDYLRKVYGLKPSESYDKDNTFWKFTENLNVLIENGSNWRRFTEGHRRKPYKDCVELYNRMKTIWIRNKDLNNLIEKIFKVKKMDKKAAIIITPNWGDYAKNYLKDCIESIRNQDYRGKKKIFITDNETSPESSKLLTEIASEAALVLNKTNDGYAKGCNDSIREALEQGYEYIAIFNIHSILEPNCLSEMVRALEYDQGIGIIQGRIMLLPEKDKVHSLGNVTHFLGFGYCNGYQKIWEDQIIEVTDIVYPSGSSILAKREVLEKIGLFDKEYWMYNEDQDLGWRTWLAGWRCAVAPQAVMYNKYEFQRSIKKYYWMDRNRVITILKNYHLLTLVLIAPAFIIMELGLILFSLKTGWFKEKLKVWAYFCIPKTWIYLAKARKESQSLRQTKDKEIVKMFSGRIWYQEVGDWKLRLINPFFNLYWKIIKLFIIW